MREYAVLDYNFVFQRKITARSPAHAIAVAKRKGVLGPIVVPA